MRLARQTNRLDAPEVVGLRPELVGLSKHEAVVSALPERASLIRESAAELGVDAPDLLVLALERLGLEVVNRDHLTDELLELVEAVGDYSQVRSDVRIAQATAGAMANAIRRGQVDAESLRVLAALYAASVDRLSKQTFA